MSFSATSPGFCKSKREDERRAWWLTIRLTEYSWWDYRTDTENNLSSFAHLMKTEILEILTWIPFGRVTSYGHVAELLDIHFGIKTSGWMVWKILSSMNAEEQLRYPWRRVINKEWYVSSMKLWERWLRHKILLEKEKISIINDVVDMKKFGRKRQ